MKNKGPAMHLHKLLIVVSAAVILTACGGGDGDSGQPSLSAASAEPVKTEIVLKSGAETLVEGTITTNKWLLESARWQSFAMSVAAPDLSLYMRNQDCTVVTKDDQASTILDGLGKSTWTCNLGIVGPAVSADTLYTLLLVGRDVKGQAQTLTRTLRVQP
jgi:hypothetical protein